MAGKYFSNITACTFLWLLVAFAVKEVITVSAVYCIIEGMSGSTMAKTVQFYIGISYWFFVVISGPTDILKSPYQPSIQYVSVYWYTPILNSKIEIL